MTQNNNSAKTKDKNPENSFFKKPLGAIIAVIGLTGALLGIIQVLYVNPLREENQRQKDKISDLTNQLGVCQQNLTGFNPACAGNSSPGKIADVIGSNLDCKTDITIFKAWSKDSGNCVQARIFNDAVRENVIRLTYHVIKGGYAVWQLELNNIDISDYDSLTFYIKGITGGEKVNAHLITNGNDASQAANGWVSTASYCEISKVWRKVSFPLTDFTLMDTARNLDLKHVNLLQFAFEWEIMQGDIFIDDINFE